MAQNWNAISSQCYLAYSYNRFQACRFGYDATLVDPIDNTRITLFEDLLSNLESLTETATELGIEDCRMGYQPRIEHYQREAFEAAHRKANNPDFQIKDYQHSASNDWRTPSAWHPAGDRETYFPWVMSEPALTQHGLGIKRLSCRLTAWMH